MYGGGGSSKRDPPLTTTTSDIKYKSKHMSRTWCLNVYILTYWSGPGSQGSEVWSFMFGDYTENWASISLLKPRGAQWLSGLFSLTGRWKWGLVFGHASLRENLAWDINKGLKSERNHSGPISHGWKRVISQCATHISHSFHHHLFHFHKTLPYTKLSQTKAACPQAKEGLNLPKPSRPLQCVTCW